jgi:NAD(P)-dependent dehydrogenase (short-subunit alcohol dehydrogenase family)
MSALAGQAAFLTGASGAIGGALARALADQGAALFLCGRDQERLEAIADVCRTAGAHAISHPGELTREWDIDQAVARVMTELGGVDLLLHGLGAFHRAPFADTTAADLDHLLRVNLRSPFLLTRRLLPALLERQGQVVFVNSSAGVRAHAQVGPYAASKAALKALADALRDEVNPHGVRVLSVFPGRTASRMQEEVRRLEGQPYDPDQLMRPEDVAHAVVAALTLDRSAELTELFLRPLRG